MRCLRFAIITIAGLGLVFAADGPTPRAWAAFETEVLSAAEPDKPLPDVHLGVTFDRTMKRAEIRREWVQDGRPLDQRELVFVETVQRLLFDLRLGLFRDLEFHAQAPLVLNDDSEIRFDFDNGVDGFSTIFGSDNADVPGSEFQYPLTEVPSSRRRAGFGDMTFGLSWSPLVDTKDPSFPTVTFRGDVVTPTGNVRDPTDQRTLAGAAGSGDVGRGQLVFDVSVAISKRMGGSAPYLDPYLVFGGRFPVAMGEQRDRGLEPPVSGRIKLGTAAVFAEQRRGRRYAVDLAFGLRYIASGRTYSELSDYLPNFDQTQVPDNPVYDDYDDPSNYATQLDSARCGILDGVPCGELNQVEQHLMMTGSLVLHLQPSRWIRFRLGADASFTTPHILTGERVGEDTDAGTAAGLTCGSTPCVGRINIANSRGEDERSRFFDPRYDTVGRRLRAQRILTLRIFATTFFTF